MATEYIREALSGASAYLTEHPDEARYTDGEATARLEEGLRFRVENPDGAAVTTDMPPSVGGGGRAPSAGWLFRAALASCVGTVTAMRAAQEGVALDTLEVTVDSESDDRGILGLDPSVPAGPLSIRVRVRVTAPGEDPERLRAIAAWGSDHCPVCDTAKRAVPVSLEVEPA